MCLPAGHYTLNGARLAKLVGQMAAFDNVIKVVKEWQCSALPHESKYRDALAAHLRDNLKDSKIETEYRHLGTTADIYIKQPGFFGSSEVFVELKRNLASKTELDRLVGQIECLEPKKNFIILVLCGQTKPSLLERLRERYKVPENYRVYRLQFEIVVKEHPIEERRPKRKRKEPGDDEVRALVDLHKRKILATRLVNNYFPELSRLRATFLRFDLAGRSPANQEFFKKWLTNPLVEMGCAPAGFWTRDKVSELYADVERIEG